MRSIIKSGLLRKQRVLMIIVFALAVILRLIYLVQILDAPYFEHPAGDSRIFYARSQEILGGDIIGSDIFFYSSPLYPYFMALIFWLTGNSFFFLGLIQILIGSANCLLIFLLAKKLSGNELIPAFIAGILAALYGLLAFFDADILMIFLTLVFVDLTLLLLLEFKNSNKFALVFGAGLCFGLAALDRVNLLLFLPVVCWYLAGEYSFKIKKWKLKPVLLFAAGVIIMFAPVTIRNYLVSHDFVLVSSNAGVNFFIGNNPNAPGVFYLPPESGLSNYDLHGTSVAVAENEMRRKLKPSQVSKFWMRKASDFIYNEPLKEVALLWQKLLLLWNAYEIPNNLNFYYIRSEFASILNIMFIGFWLVTPLAVLGIFCRWKQGLHSSDKLLVGFLITYMVSIMPFFITERYRLPMVPILIVYAAVCITSIFNLVKARAIKRMAWLGLGLIGVIIFVNWPRMRFDDTRMRVVIGSRFLERALENPRIFGGDIRKAIIELKWAVETDPLNAHAHYQLAKAYASFGYYSGAIQELNKTLEIDPQRESAIKALSATHAKFEKDGDRTSSLSVPKTLYEEALVLEEQEKHEAAIRKYKEIIRKDPFHFLSYNNLGILLYERGRVSEAIQIFKEGLKIMPHNVLLLFDLGSTYYKQGEKKKAKQIWNQCLDMHPNFIPAVEALKMFEREPF